MLVEMAIGDAYGAAFEFIKLPHPALVHDTETYQKHPELEIGNGRYTDDTQMALAIAEHLISGEEMTVEALAERFVQTFKRDPRPGYGKGFYEALQNSTDGPSLLTNIQNPTSTRSGAAMRVSPIGLIGDFKEVMRLAALQATVTHNSPEGILSAQAVAGMVHYFAYNLGTDHEVGPWLEENVPGWAWDDLWTDWVSVQGIPNAHAAVTCVTLGRSLRGVLKMAVDVGGDVDTVSAISMFSASLTQMPDDLPASLYRGLEQGPYGGGYLVEMDYKLRDFARKQGAKI